MPKETTMQVKLDVDNAPLEQLQDQLKTIENTGSTVGKGISESLKEVSGGLMKSFMQLNKLNEFFKVKITQLYLVRKMNELNIVYEFKLKRKEKEEKLVDLNWFIK